MKTILAVLAAVLVSATSAHAQKIYDQAELDALLAPVALHPDGLLSQILMAATYPQEVAAAAQWSRANPHLRGDDAVRAVQNEPWDPSVKALVAFPDLLARMDESPQWLHDLGEAFLLQEAQVMDTVQGLRRRAAASGYLTSNEQHAVYYQGDAIVVQPRAQIVYVSYYDPYVVYGPWWWPYYRPVFWRPWAPRPVFVSYGFFYSSFDWPHRYVRVVHRPVFVNVHHTHVVPGRWQHRQRVVAPISRPHVAGPSVQPHVRIPEAQRRPIVQSAPLVAPVTREAPRQHPSARDRAPTPREQRRVPESRNQPIVHGAPPVAREAPRQAMPAAAGFSREPRDGRREFRAEMPRHEQRVESRREHRERAVEAVSRGEGRNWGGGHLNKQGRGHFTKER